MYFFLISAQLAQEARAKCVLDNNVKVYGVLGPICESHQPGITKEFVKEYGKLFLLRINFSYLPHDYFRL